MIPVFLTNIKTRDGLTLEGIIRHPKDKKRTALIWIHGLTSHFSSSQKRSHAISDACIKNGIGFFMFNTRGANVANLGGKKYSLIGTGFENFKECTEDIHAMILTAKRLGYTRIILAGHSTGANKALYYLYKRTNHAVKGLILLGPASDIDLELTWRSEGGQNGRLAIAKRLYKKDRKALMPARFGLLSAKRYISLYTPGSAEDVFPYYNPRATWKELKSIRIPVAVIFGASDACIMKPRTTEKLIALFKEKSLQAKSFTGINISGTGHSFKKKELALATAITRWIQKN